MRRRRTDQQVSTALWLIVVFVAALTAAGCTSLFIITRQDVTNLAAEAEADDADIATLSDQVRDLGGEPAVTPEAAPEDGTDGADGADGPTGRDGRDGSDGLTIIGPPGANGADGAPGKDGADGAAGANGATGEPGPQGPPGQSVMGPQGIPGLNGQDGPPVGSFSFVAAGVTYVCSDPDGDLAYECAQVVP